MSRNLLPTGRSSNSGSLVSVVISNRNDVQHLRECLQSLLGQTYCNFEVIVVDAASSDGSADMVASEFPNFRLLKTGIVGPIEANNLGFLAAKGDYVVLDLNSDDVVSPTWLSNLLQVMQKDPRIGVAGGKRLVYGAGMIDCAGAVINFLTGATPPLGRGRKGNAAFESVFEVDYVPVMMIRRQVVAEVGLLDESYVFYYEEPDFCLRAKRAHYKVVCVPDAVHWHHGSATIGKLSLRKYYYLRRNQIRFTIKNCPIRYLFFTLVWLLVIRTLIDSLCSIPASRRVLRLVAPNSFWSNLDKRTSIVQLQVIRWNLDRTRETLKARASIRKIGKRDGRLKANRD